MSNEENVSILSMINKHIFFLIVSLISTKCFRRQRLRFAMNFSFSFSLQIASTFLSNNSCVKSFITDITVEALSFIKKVHRYTSVIKFKLNSSQVTSITPIRPRVCERLTNKARSKDSKSWSKSVSEMVKPKTHYGPRKDSY